MSPYVDTLTTARRVAIIGDAAIRQRNGYDVPPAFCDAGYDGGGVNPE